MVGASFTGTPSHTIIRTKVPEVAILSIITDAMAELAVQKFPCSENMGFYGTNGELEHLGDFLIASLLHVPELDDFAVLFGQLPDGLLEHCRALVANDTFVRLICLVRKLKREVALLRLDRFVNGIHLQLAFPDKIDAVVCRDLVQPGGERKLLVETLEGLKRLNECLLCEVFDLLVLMHHTIDEVEDLIVVLFHQPGVCLVVTLEGTLDETGILST